MSIGNFYTQGGEYLQHAIQYDKTGKLPQALQHYITALEYLTTASRQETDPELKQKLLERIDVILDRCEKLEMAIKQGPPQPPAPIAVAGPTHPAAISPSGPGTGTEGGSTTSSWFVQEKPHVEWDEVIGLKDVKQTMIETFDLPLRFPSLYTGARLPWSTVLLYGPPGTGKTTIMKALATKLNAAAFFSVKSSDIISKYHGESEKNISQLFAEARKLATDTTPVIIFIDEVESLCSERQSGGDSAQSANTRIVTEFLQQVDGFASNNKNIFIVGATNLPWQLDAAMQRRFQKHIYVPLPNGEDRIQIIKQFISKNNHLLSEADFVDLANQMEGYSGSDIKDIFLAAVFAPVGELLAATQFFKHPQSGKWIPVLDNLPELKQTYGPSLVVKEMQWNELSDKDIDSDMLPVTKSHILDVLKTTKPTTLPHKLQEYQHWNNRSDEPAPPPPPLMDLL